jgi:hypothetical protein
MAISLLVIARSEATWQSLSRPSSPGAKRRGNLSQGRHRQERSNVAISLKVVIARSEATWQSPSRSSLRGAKRRGNLPQGRHRQEQSGEAISLIVIARSEAPWRSPLTLVNGLIWSSQSRNNRVVRFFSETQIYYLTGIIGGDRIFSLTKHMGVGEEKEHAAS